MSFISDFLAFYFVFYLEKVVNLLCLTMMIML